MEERDKRYRKTHLLIKNCFIEMYKADSNRARITPTNICRKLDINRGTFYKHFETLELLIRELEEDYANKLIDVCAVYHYDKDTQTFFNFLFNAVKENTDLFYFFFYISDGTGERLFEDYLLKTMIPKWLERSSINASEAKIVVKYQLTGTFALLKEWYEHDFENEAEYRHVFERIIKYGLYDMVYLDKHE